MICSAIDCNAKIKCPPKCTIIFFSIGIRISNHGDLPVANKNWLKRVSLNRILNVSSDVSCPGVPYSSVPARESVAGCQMVPFFTRRTSVHPPLSIEFDHTTKK